MRIVRSVPRPSLGVCATFVTLSLALPGTGRLAAGTVELKNDSVVDFGQVAIQSGFVAGELGSAWLTSTCTGDLTAVRILWLSASGGTPSVLHEAIRINQAGSFPTPGPLIREMLGPVMQDGGFNEFQVVPPIPVNSGETVVVSFLFLVSPTPGNGPSLCNDTDGCQAGRNGIFANPPGAWFSACALGVSGDFAIRAVVDCSDNGIFADGFESGDTGEWSSTQN
jgi:hypothetical protein